ncbi:MAG: hypothetical protein R2864_05875 [Syntrophotaleaceae bacterium]
MVRNGQDSGVSSRLSVLSRKAGSQKQHVADHRRREASCPVSRAP